MKLQEFLDQVMPDQYALRAEAIDIINDIGQEAFQELSEEMQGLIDQNKELRSILVPSVKKTINEMYEDAQENVCRISANASDATRDYFKKRRKIDSYQAYYRGWVDGAIKEHWYFKNIIHEG